MDRQPAGYRLISYGDMITERPRMEPYAEALRHIVQPDSVVLDLGAGTGIFSLLACQWGARHVFAVEPDDAIRTARAIAEVNGCADRITFYQAISTEITLPRPADVIISDLRGVLPLFQNHIPSIIDARQRHLAPNGTLIPQCDVLWASLVNDPKLYHPYAEPWLDNDYGLDMSAGYPLVVNTWRKTNVQFEQLLVPPQRWAILDYATIQQPNVDALLTWTAERTGTAHGLLVWFDAELAEGVGFSNAPGQPELIYGQAFFPLEAPVDLEIGERIEVALHANLIDGEYVWRWNTQVFPQDVSKSPRAAFKQSTFNGMPLSLDRLHKYSKSFKPRLDLEGQIDALVLNAMNGQYTNGEIATQVMIRFPARFPHERDALSRVGELSVKYHPQD